MCALRGQRRKGLLYDLALDIIRPRECVRFRGATKKGLIYDLALDPSGVWAVAAVQGEALIVFDISTGQQVSPVSHAARSKRPGWPVLSLTSAQGSR